MTIAVRNPGRRPKTFMVVGGETVKMRHLGTEVKASGESVLRLKHLEVPSSVTVPAGGVVSGLPDGCAAEAKSKGLLVFKVGE